jgi:nicotinate-nucleotide pyrophosphorylase (carboxylating)
MPDLPNMLDPSAAQALHAQVFSALEEDGVFADPSSALLPKGATAYAKLLCRENAVLCGQPWVDAVYSALDAHRGTHTELEWQISDGAHIQADQIVLKLRGDAGTLLSGERVALNFLQLLSGVASGCAQYCQLLGTRKVKLLDTRKTLPGMRIAQRYAVRIGGGMNHRTCLREAFMLKENHLKVLGDDIPAAVTKAREYNPSLTLIVEVETLDQLKMAITAGVDIALLDNFSLEDMRQAVHICKGQVALEASGNIGLQSIVGVADTGVDRISVGGLTKHVRAIDFSMRFFD